MSPGGSRSRSGSAPPLRPRSAETVRELSEELVALQQPIRVLDAVAWDDEVERGFRAAGGRRQPEVDADYYRDRRPLRFDPDELRGALVALRARTRERLGDEAVALLMLGRIDEYVRVVELLEARGTAAFGPASRDLFGGVDDEIHPGGPTLAELGDIMNDALARIDAGPWDPPEEPSWSAPESVERLAARFAEVPGLEAVRVMLDDGIVADAAAGGDYVKLRDDARFSDRDLRVLEVHEGWVHVATTLNGRSQPWCTFLGKGTPSTTSTQEGLAVFTEITTLSSTPDRLRRVTRRMHAIAMAEEGATFLTFTVGCGRRGSTRARRGRRRSGSSGGARPRGRRSPRTSYTAEASSRCTT